MDDFEQLKNTWKEQPIQKPSEKNFTELKSRIKNVAKKQSTTNVILLSTVGVLIVFFFYIDAMAYKDVALALGAMIGVLVIRVLVELYSISYLKNLSVTTNIQNFKGRLQNYIKRRIIVHMVFTPVLLAIYSYAFWTLLPDFKASLSEGFYNYVVWSSLVLLVFYMFFIFFQVRKEIDKLKELND